MNGKNYDDTLELLSEIKGLINIDKKRFCLSVLGNMHINFTNYGIETHGKEMNILREKIESDTFDYVAVDAAKFLFNIIYEDYAFRLENNIRKYESLLKREVRKSRRNAMILNVVQRMLQLIIILGATVLPFILNSAVSKLYSSVLSISVAIAAALITFYKFNKYISYFQKAAENMQREYNLYHSGRKHYSALKKGAALDLLMDKIDELREEQDKFSLELEKTEQGQEQIIQDITKGLRK